MSKSKCGQPCQIFSRVVGYYSVVNLTWNKGKVEEFKDRKTYLTDRKSIEKYDSTLDKKVG